MRATAQSVRVSTRKVRLVADAIRNMSATQALATLAFVNKRGSSVLKKVLQSAIANAVNNNKLLADDLIIAKLDVNEGQFLKRFHASTRGRIKPFKKRSTHVTVVLATKEVKTEKIMANKEEVK
jgi:large subunit ribosomal protein L22